MIEQNTLRRRGTGLIAARTRRPGWHDALALIVVAGACFGATQLPGS